jgi:hypothetical protein
MSSPAYMTAEDWRKQQILNSQTQPVNPRVEEALAEREEALTGVSIGSKKLLRLLYQKKAEGVIILPASTIEIPIETLGQSQFSYYHFDVVCLNDDLIDVYIGSGVTGGAVAGGVQCSILKRRNFKSPDKIDVILLIDSVVGGDVSLAYRVYRIAGLE